MEIMLIDNPSLVVEAGSGVSTFVIAYFLKQKGRGTVISFEQDEKFASLNRKLISSNGYKGSLLSR